uniref:Uncharacterized protein n=1 Tax=viral metagenome TaxID=1070528 RepID=A0A6C0KU49_9ZZZZ
MAVNLESAISHLKNYFEKLKVTNIHYIYFRYDRTTKKCTPYILDRLREWMVHGSVIYSICTDNGWCYNYGITTLKRLVYVDNKGVVSFEKYLPGAPIDNSSIPSQITSDDNSSEIEGIIGDHITVGIENSRYPNDLLVRSHKTYYVEETAAQNIEYDRFEDTCNFLLKQSINESTQCTSRKSMGTQYRNEPLAIPIIKTITDIYKGIQTGGGTPPKKYYMHKGKEYNIHKGKRGGTYIRVGNIRKYIGGMRKQMYEGVGFDNDGFLTFLDKYLFSVVIQKYSIDGITIIYDEDSELQENANKYICIIYEYTYELIDEKAKASFYYLNAMKAFKAYHAYKIPERERSMMQKSCLQEFLNESKSGFIKNLPQTVSGGKYTV